jgi:hypothetical protein
MLPIIIWNGINVGRHMMTEEFYYYHEGSDIKAYFVCTVARAS